MRFVKRDGAVLVIGGPVPPGSDGLTIGRYIMIRKGHEDSEYLIAHEMVHVRQYWEQGVPRFLATYLRSYLQFRRQGLGHHAAYLRIPQEVEADQEARRTLGWEAG